MRQWHSETRLLFRLPVNITFATPVQVSVTRFMYLYSRYLNYISLSFVNITRATEARPAHPRCGFRAIAVRLNRDEQKSDFVSFASLFGGILSCPVLGSCRRRKYTPQDAYILSRILVRWESSYLIVLAALAQSTAYYCLGTQICDRLIPSKAHTKRINGEL